MKIFIALTLVECQDWLCPCPDGMGISKITQCPEIRSSVHRWSPGSLPICPLSELIHIVDYIYLKGACSPHTTGVLVTLTCVETPNTMHWPRMLCLLLECVCSCQAPLTKWVRRRRICTGPCLLSTCHRLVGTRDTESFLVTLLFLRPACAI